MNRHQQPDPTFNTRTAPGGGPPAGPLASQDAHPPASDESGPDGSEEDAETELSALSIDELRAELRRRQKRAGQLSRERAKLRARLAEIERELAELTAPPDPVTPPARRPAADVRPFQVPLSDLSVVDALVRVVLVDEEITPRLAEARLRERGYGARKANLRASVSQALSKEPRFRRVAHGRYVRVI